MSKSSKLLKLLSASAIVAGGNFYALADCELCGGHDHEVTADKPCPNFDYAGFAKELGREDRGILDSGDKWLLWIDAKRERKIADRFLKNVPTSSNVSFATSTRNASKLTDTKPTYTEGSSLLEASDAETAIESEEEDMKREDLESEITPVMSPVTLTVDTLKPVDDTSKPVDAEVSSPLNNSEVSTATSELNAGEMKSEKAEYEITPNVSSETNTSKPVDTEVSYSSDNSGVNTTTPELNAEETKSEEAEYKITPNVSSETNTSKLADTEDLSSLNNFEVNTATSESNAGEMKSEEAKTEITPNVSSVDTSKPADDTLKLVDTEVSYSSDNSGVNTATSELNAEETKSEEAESEITPNVSSETNTSKLADTEPVDTEVSYSSNNSEVSTAISDSDAEAMRREAAASKITEALRENKERREKAAMKIQNARRAQLERRQEREEMELGQALQNLFDEKKASEEEARMAREREVRSKERDSEQLQAMMTGILGKHKKSDAKEYAEEMNPYRREQERVQNARTARREAAKEAAEEIKGEDLQNLFKEEKSGDADANKIQNAIRRHLARKKAAKLQKQQAAAQKITAALRKNMKAQRQKQIEEDGRFAAELQAEYDAEDAQIKKDRQFAEKLQAEYDAEFAEEQRRLEKEADRIAREDAAAKQQRIEETMATTAEQETMLSADDEVETKHWKLPETTASKFRGYNHESKASRFQANAWATQLKDLSIRKIECIFWLISVRYNRLQEGGDYARLAQMAEAITDVDNIFPYGGTNAGVMNVYNALKNTDTADFCGDLEKLGRNALDGVLYQVASRYRRLLNDGKKAASQKFVDLARYAIEACGEDWQVEDVLLVPENKDVRPAPRALPNLGDLVNKASKEDKDIIETEASENSTWDPPYRVYYSYCENLMPGLHPSSKSMERFQDKDNRGRLYQDELRNLSIRRLEALIHLANTNYLLDLENGAMPVSQEIAGLVREVDCVFLNTGEGKANARVMNACNAFRNIVDQPNDNPVSRQPFQRGFRELTTHEKVTALGDMAVVYREMLRSGKRPASLAFVNWADAMCKALNLDGFVKGEDNVHPVLRFEEFESEAKPTVAPKNDDLEPVITVGDREELNHSMADGDIISESEPREEQDWNLPSNPESSKSFLKELEGLSIRRLEIVMYLAACQYGCRDRNELRGTDRAWEIAKRMRDDLFNGPRDEKNLRLFNAFLALKHQQALKEEFYGYRGDGCYYYEDAFQGKFRRLKTGDAEAVLGIISTAYRIKLRHEHKPSHPLFVEFADQMCKQLSLDGWWEEVEAPASKHPEYPEFNNAATPSAHSYGDKVAPRRSALGYDNGELVTAGE